MENLKLLDLDQPLEGFRHFISCWLYSDANVTFIVDPGPASTADFLVSKLREYGVDRLDFVLVTHIHIDHAGGLAQILEAFPDARYHCHELGKPHVEEPDRLWRGSLKILGHIAEVYGAPKPVDSRRYIGAEELSPKGIYVIDGPGHAAHHLCFTHNDVLFAGEALGVSVPLASEKIYLRPAMPPRFYYDVAMETIASLASLEPEPRYVALAHYGLVQGTREWCARAKSQLELWVETVQNLSGETESSLEKLVYERLTSVDSLYGQGRFDELDDDIKKRELRFLSNTVNGIRGYLDSK